MEWFVNYVLPSITTIVSGVVVYLLGQYFYTVWLMPLQEYKKIKDNTTRLLEKQVLFEDKKVYFAP